MKKSAVLSQCRAARRGPFPLEAEQRRTYCVSVWLNQQERDHLEAVRGRWRRGEWLRMAALDVLPPRIPELNTAAWASLARLAANLNQYQAAINDGRIVTHEADLLPGLIDAVAHLRLSLVGGSR